jgi:hypothetical protein
MKLVSAILAICLLATPAVAKEQKILFVGNSFTFGATSATLYYKSDTVTDLNNANLGGVPALFERFTEQAGLDYKVSLETYPGVGLDWHFNNRLSVLTSQSWDAVVMHGFSTMDAAKPGDPAKLIEYSGRLARAFVAQNAATKIFLTATWSRADLVYRVDSPWKGTPITKMGQDIRAGYDAAKAASPQIAGVIPVGEAWNLAFTRGIADSNPYDGIDYGKMDLWGWDSYHASNYGYYLHALVVFAQVTGIDPRTLGPREKAALDLGISPSQATSLQTIAFDITQSQ